MLSVRELLRTAITSYCKPGEFYKIPFGSNRGKFIEFDPSLNLSMLLGLHEPNTFEVFRQLIQPGMVVADIGANKGYFSIYLDDLVGEEGVVYAFEPVPDTFATLERMLKRNGCRRVRAVRKAITNEDKPCQLYLSHSHYMSSLAPEWAGYEGGSIDVEGIRLDTFFASEGRGPDFIKMDIEGGGVYALPGMADLIRSCQPCMLLESHTPQEDRAIGHALSLIDYAVFRCGSEIPVTNLVGDYTDPYGIWGTVVAIPRNRLATLHGFNPHGFSRWRLGERKTLYSVKNLSL
jgi:FkbM family methyltransferase